MPKSEKPTQPPKKEAVKRGKNGGARPGAGRPAFEPTDVDRKQVEAMAGYGVPFEQIAALIRGGISIDTLRSHFSFELISGKAKANAQVGKGVFQKAMSGDTTAMIWWTKTQMRWKEVQQHEITGPGGGPVPLAHITADDLTDDQLAAILKADGADE